MHKFVFISCCWWLLNCWNQIGETGIVVYGFVEKIVVVLVFWENLMILVKWVGLLFLMLDSCLFKCIEAILTHKQFLEHVLGLGVIKIGIFGWKWVEHEDLNFCPEVLFRTYWSEALFRSSRSEAMFRSYWLEALFRSSFQKLLIRSEPVQKRTAPEQHPLFCVLVSFSHISVLNWLLV